MTKVQGNKIASLEGKIQALSAELIGFRALKDEIAALKAEKETWKAKQSADIPRLWKLVERYKENWVSAGACQFKVSFFKSLAGQKFLKTFKDELIKAYLHSPASIKDLSKHLGYFMDGVDGTVFELCNVPKSMRSAYNISEIGQRLNQAEAGELLGIDANADEKDPWYIPSMEAAANILIRADLDIHAPLPEEERSSGDFVPGPLEFDLPCLQGYDIDSVGELAGKYQRANLDIENPKLFRLLERMEHGGPELGDEGSSTKDPGSGYSLNAELSMGRGAAEKLVVEDEEYTFEDLLDDRADSADCSVRENQVGQATPVEQRDQGDQGD